MLFDRRAELNVLISLALIDNVLHPKEAGLIRVIGRANDIPLEEIEQMIQNPEPVMDLHAMTEEEKFEHLFYLVQLMKADGRVLTTEIEFCESIAEKLNFKPGVIGALSAHIYSDPGLQTDHAYLLQKMEAYRKR